MPTRHDLTTRRGTFSSRRTYDSQTGGKLSTQSGLGFGTAGAAYGFSSMTGRQVTQSVDLSYPDAAADWTTNFAYDLDGRLVGAKNSGEATVAYSYAAAGHMLAAGSRTMTYTPAGRLASSVGPEGSVTYYFDSRGRRSRMVSVVASATYLYDAADQLVGFKRDNGKNGSIDVDATHNYDAQGHRTRSVVTSAGATKTTFYAFEGLALLGLRSTAGGSTTRLSFLYDASGNPYAGTASLLSGQSVAFGIVTTDRGDIVELVSESGEAFAYWRYDAFGQPLPGKTRAVTDVDASAAAAVASALALRYAGYVYDAESELYCAGRRFYDPKTCQFLTADPLRSDGEESLYQYCAGDPVGNTDPSGLVLDSGTGRMTTVNIIATNYSRAKTPAKKAAELGKLRQAIKVEQKKVVVAKKAAAKSSTAAVRPKPAARPATPAKPAAPAKPPATASTPAPSTTTPATTSSPSSKAGKSSGSGSRRINPNSLLPTRPSRASRAMLAGGIVTDLSSAGVAAAGAATTLAGYLPGGQPVRSVTAR